MNVLESDIRRWKAQRSIVLRRFRPRKADRLGYVFVGLHGKRLDKPGKRKGYLLYIGRTGKVAVADRHLNPSTIGGTQPSQFGRYKTAQKKWFAARSYRATPQESFKLRPTKREKGHVDFERYASRVAAVLKRIAPRFGGSFSITTHFTVKLPGGRTKAIASLLPVEFHIAKYQGLERAQFRRFAFLTLYAQMAEYLTGEGLVSFGSSRYISKLSINRGQPRRKWVTERDELWEKTQLKVVKIVEMSFKVDKVIIQNAKRKSQRK